MALRLMLVILSWVCFCRSYSQRLVTLSVMVFTMIRVEDPRYKLFFFAIGSACPDQTMLSGYC